MNTSSAQSPGILQFIISYSISLALLIGIYFLIDQLLTFVFPINSETSYYVGLVLVVFFGYGAYSKIVYRFINPVIIAIALIIWAINIVLLWVF